MEDLNKKHENKPKKIYLYLLLIGFVIWIIFDSVRDYTWADQIIEKKTSEGYIVLKTQANYIFNPLKIWLFFKTPTTSIAFFKEKGEVKIGEEKYKLVEEMWTFYKQSTTFFPIPEFTFPYFQPLESYDAFLMLVDCKNGQLAFIENDQELSTLSIYDIKWKPPDIDTSQKIIEITCFRNHF